MAYRPVGYEIDAGAGVGCSEGAFPWLAEPDNPVTHRLTTHLGGFGLTRSPGPTHITLRDSVARDHRMS